MGHRLLNAGDACWRPSNQMGVLNTDLAKQAGAGTLGVRTAPERCRPSSRAGAGRDYGAVIDAGAPTA
jgi:hypothetical protein